jgi:lantibiotic biosynthesis protein
MSRLRAYEILHDETCKREAIAALRTTCHTFQSSLQNWTGNFSMCHGLTGNAEVLSYAADMFGWESEPGAEVALNVARYGIDRYFEKGPWPCGTHVGETPNFMLGLADIGHFYLRLDQPSIPSILILRKDTWRNGGSKNQDLVNQPKSIELCRHSNLEE